MRIFLVTMLVAMSAQAALAGRIVLKNGDVITGDILYFDGSDVKVENDYIDGDFLISLDKIAEIESTTEMTVQYKDGDVMTGKLGTDDEGSIVIVDESGQTAALDLERLDELEPVDEWFQWGGDVNLGFSGASGNTKNSAFHLDGSLRPSFGPNHLILKGQLNEDTATTDGTKNSTASNWRVLLQYNRDLSYKWYLYGANQWENDDLKDLNLRMSLSGGAGYKIWQADYRDWWIELGPAYVVENFKFVSKNEKYAALRWALNFEHDIYSDDFRFYHNHALLESVQDLSRFVLQTTTGFKFEIIADLVGAIELQYDFNNRPAADAGKNDTRYMFKLGYEFGD